MWGWEGPIVCGAGRVLLFCFSPLRFSSACDPSWVGLILCFLSLSLTPSLSASLAHSAGGAGVFAPAAAAAMTLTLLTLGRTLASDRYPIGILLSFGFVL